MGFAQAVSDVEMRRMECGDCGITHWVPESYMERRAEDGKGWHCPNGHVRVFRITELAKVRQQLEEEKHRRELAEQDAEWNRARAKNAETQTTKARNALKRVETRVNSGVCPHCNRTFKQLAAHMKCKHAKLMTPKPAA